MLALPAVAVTPLGTVGARVSFGAVAAAPAQAVRESVIVSASAVNRLAASGRCTGRPPSVGKVQTYIAQSASTRQGGVVSGVRFTGTRHAE
ncbi:hypothetical protein GCM10010299_47870 [Streptomyces tanashiensis]|nr:hypothetical protein GCM10010299_47870 [Streptomyces tanashiensis]